MKNYIHSNFNKFNLKKMLNFMRFYLLIQHNHYWPQGFVELEFKEDEIINSTKMLWGVSLHVSSPKSKTLGLFKISRWFVLTKTNSIWCKRKELSLFLDVRQNGQTMLVEIPRRINQHNRRFQALSRWIITPNAWAMA